MSLGGMILRAGCRRAWLVALVCALVAGPNAPAEGHGPDEGTIVRLPATELLPSPACEACPACGSCWQWQFVPDGLMYRSYLAGRESRMASTWFFEEGSDTWLWDISLGGRAGLLRYGTQGGERPEGWQLDAEVAAFPRLDMTDDRRELVSSDFRAGFPLTYGQGPFQFKFAYYHLSSHLGDEFMLRNPGAVRLNFTRDALVWGVSCYATDDVRVYGEAGWAFHYDGGAQPWEFQFGTDFAPAGPTGPAGAPFAAVNAHLREEADFGGTLTVHAGWQWRGDESGHLFRVGGQYLTGKSPQLEFPTEDEEQLGLGVWYDF
jgi:hypothetical protein